MLKLLFAPLRWIIRSLFLLIFLLCLIFALIQTKWVQELIQKKVTQLLDELGIQIKLKGLSGILPFSWQIDQATLFTSPYESWDLQAIKLRFAISPLMRGQLVIDYLHIEQMGCISVEDRPTIPPLSLDEARIQLRKALDKLSFSLPVRVKHAYVSDFFCPSLFPLHLTIQAKGMLKNTRRFFFDASVLSKSNDKEILHLTFAGNKRRNQINAYVKLQGPLFEQELLSELSLNGLWSSWDSLLYDTRPITLPIQGFLKAHLIPEELPKETCLKPSQWDWKCACSFSVPKFDTLSIYNLHIYSPPADIRGEATLRPTWDSTWFRCKLNSRDLSLLSSYCKYPIEGSLQARAAFDSGVFQGKYSIPKGLFNQIEIAHLEGFIQGKMKQGNFFAETDLSLEIEEMPFRADASLEYIPSEAFLIDKALFTGGSSKMEGFCSWNLKKNIFEGSVFANIEQLSQLFSFTSYDLDGSCALECKLSQTNQTQVATISGSLHRFRFQNHYANELLYSAELYDPFTNIQGNMHLIAHKGRTALGTIDLLEIKTRSEDNAWPFTLEATGDIEGEFFCDMQGSYRFHSDFLAFECTSAKGQLLNIPFILRQPFELEIQPSLYTLSPFSLSAGEGDLYATGEISPTHLLGKCDANHFPLEFVRPFTRNLSLRGNLSMQSFVDATLENAEGTCNIVIETASLLQENEDEPILAKGSLQAHLNQKKVQFFVEVRTKQAEMIDFSGFIPIEYSFFPFKAKLDENTPFSAELIAEGKLENLFDFVQLGSHYATGLISTRLFFSQNLLSPRLQGNLEWQSGSYDNYYTGTSLRDIQAKIAAENNQLQLTSFTAYDQEEGVVTATGHLLLDVHKQFPFVLEATLRHTHLLKSPVFDSTFTGSVTLSGNRLGGLAKGTLYVDEAIIEIPNKLSTELPPLPIKFVHIPPSITSYTFDAKTLFPIKLDFDLTAKDKIFVRGKGVDSEWKGKVKLTGDNAHFIPDGSLSLIKGEYIFSGKVFKLTEGQIVFNDTAKFSSYLQLSGQLTLSDVVITAQLKGPLQSPQLTFQSNPQLPTSAILSRVLFDKDITSISQSEASKLASALITLSGSAGPDILNAIRKTIHADRLNIVPGSSDSEEFAVQIGKYITKGVLITLSQSTTSSHVIVEIELPYGFVFQAETQEEQEGKFSLKWTKSY